MRSQLHSVARFSSPGTLPWFLFELQASLALWRHTAQLPGLLFLAKLHYFFSITITKVIQIIFSFFFFFLLQITQSLLIPFFLLFCIQLPSFSSLPFFPLLTSFCIPCQHTQWFIMHHDCCGIPLPLRQTTSVPKVMKCKQKPWTVRTGLELLRAFLSHMLATTPFGVAM